MSLPAVLIEYQPTALISSMVEEDHSGWSAAPAEKDLDLLKSAVTRQSDGLSREDTLMIEGADHIYTGEEAQVARKIADWVDRISGSPRNASGLEH